MNMYQFVIEFQWRQVKPTLLLALFFMEFSIKFQVRSMGVLLPI